MASIPPQEFGQTAAEQWLKDAIKPDGALAEAFAAAVQETVRKMLAEQESPLRVALGAASSAAELKASEQDATVTQLETNVNQFEAKLSKVTKVEDDLDAKFPWRVYLRDCDPGELLAGWQRLHVDKDWIENAAEQMDDPAVANCAAVCVSHPESEEAKRLKRAIMMKKAPKTSWKGLCLAPYGGGPDKFRAFISDKAALENDDTVAALARKLLHLYLLLEGQCVNPATAKPNSATKMQTQREQIMPLIFSIVKATKRKAKKAAARARR